MDQKRNRLHALLICLALATSTVLVYYQAVHFDFLDWDDLKYVTKNAAVQEGLTADGIRWAFTSDHASNWHPLTWISHMLDCELFGMNPAGPHIVNVAFHVVNTLLLFGVLARMTERLWASAMVAGLFALHPLHVESVAWVSERKDVLSTLFALLAMWTYVSYVKRHGLARYLLTTLLVALGLMAKPMLVTLPFVFLLLDYWPLNRVRFRPAVKQKAASPQAPAPLSRRTRVKGPKRAKRQSPPAGAPYTEAQGRSGRPDASEPTAAKQRSFALLLAEKAPLLLLSIASSAITYIVQERGPAMAAAGAIPMHLRAANAAVAYVWYIVKMLWPSGLGPLYTHPNLSGGTPLTVWQIGGAVVLLIGMSVLVVRAARRYVMMGWLWYLGTLVPVIGLVQVGNHAYADRYTYVPLIGLFIIVGWGSADLLGRLQRRRVLVSGIAGTLALSVLAACAACSWTQARYWRNSTTLFERAVDIEPQNPTMHFNLGNMRQADGDIDDAVHHLREAVRINPYYAKAYLNLGIAYGELGEYDEAMESLQRALQVQPGYGKAHYNLGRTLETTGRYEEALKHYREAARLDPEWEAPRTRAERLSRRPGS